MKLTVFNAETMPKRQGYASAGPRISLGKGGTLTMNNLAAELMGIEAGDAISFAQDEEDPANWYVFKDPKGFACRAHSDQKSFTFNHSFMVKSIKESLGLEEDKPARFMIAGQPNVHNKVKYWGLIIKTSI